MTAGMVSAGPGWGTLEVPASVGAGGAVRDVSDEARDAHGRWATGAQLPLFAEGEGGGGAEPLRRVMAAEALESVTPEAAKNNAPLGRVLAGESYDGGTPRLGEREARYNEEVGDPAAVQKAVEEALAKQHVWIRRTPETLIKVIDAGRFKTQFEIHKSGGMYDPSLRANYEEAAFGYDQQTPKIQRPVYGYLSDDADGGDDASEYGSIKIKLRDDHVRARTTWTSSDSLYTATSEDVDHGRVFDGEPNVLPSPLMKLSAMRSVPDYRARVLLKEYAGDTIFGIKRTSYMEAQIHGGLRTSDIEEIVIPEDAVDRDDSDSDPSHISRADIDEIKAKGFKVRIV